MASSLTSARVEPKPLGNTWDDHACVVKFCPNSPSERSDLADTAASCESEGSSDEASQRSTAGQETCPSCIGNGYHESKFGAFTCKLCKGRGSADFTDEAIPGPHLCSALVGNLVGRGPDWQCGDDDGGAGSVGKVVKTFGGGWVQVTWSNGHTDDYRAGFSNQYDLVVHKTIDVREHKQAHYVSEQDACEDWRMQAIIPLGATAGFASDMCTIPSYWNCAIEVPFGWGLHYGSKVPMYGAHAPPPLMQPSTGSIQPLPGLRTPLRRDAPLFVPTELSR